MSTAPVIAVRPENLLIDLHNPRYDPRSSQREALATICHDQGIKLYNLAEDIVDKGVNPSDLPIVTPAEEPGCYVVLEGNRRVAALKILSSTSLASSLGLTTGLLKKYMSLIDRAKNSLPSEIQCTVLPREDAKYWIMLKHTGENEGIGIVTWDGRARHRFRGSSSALQAIELVEASPYLDEVTRARLPKIAITNIERLLGTPEARDLLGIEVKNDKLTLKGPEEAALGKLALVVTDVANRTIRVTDLDNKDQRVSYAHKIAERPLPKPISETSHPAAGTSHQPVTTTRISPERNSLIPRHLKLRIPQTRINRIFAELQRLNVSDYVNSCAVLLRVFVELSVDEYAQRHRIVLKETPKPKPTRRARFQPKDMTFRQKLKTVADDLETHHGVNKHELHGVRALIYNRSHVLSVDTLNAYIHNKDYSPTPTDIKSSWDNIQTFIERLWTT